MTYIMILLFSYGPHHIEFSSQQMCENAKAKILAMRPERSTSLLCVPK